MDVFEIRRANLLELIQSKHEGNRSEFSRSVSKNINLINLCLTQNLALRRNIGEKLARDIEKAKNLPDLWLDEDRSVRQAAPVTNISRVARDASSPTDLFPERMLVGDAWLHAMFPTVDPAHIKITHMQDDSMSTTLPAGSVGIVDCSINTFKGDGVYLLARGEDSVIRRIISNIVDGSYQLVADDPRYPPAAIDAKALHKLTIRGKLIGKLSPSKL